QPITMPGSSASSVTVASGAQSAGVTNGQLGIFGQTLAGTFGFGPTAGGVTVTASSVGLSLGGGVVAVSGGAGTLTIGSGGAYGSLSASVTTSVANAQFAAGATFTLDLNTTTVAHTVTSVTLPAGPYVRVDASGVTLTVAGQSLAGSFSLETTSLPTGPAVAIAATNVSVTFGTASTGATVRNGAGELLATTNGIAGAFAGTVAIALPAQASLSGTLSLAVNTLPTAVDQSFSVDGTTLALDVPAGPYVELQGTGVTLTVLGQSVSGNVTIQAAASSATSGTVVAIGISGGAATIGGASPIITLSGVNGLLELEPTGATPATALAGTLSGTLAVAVPNVAIAGTLVLQFNTGTASEVKDSLTVGGSTVSLDVPAGQFARFAGTGLTLTIAGQTLSGDVTISAGRDAHGQPAAELTLANVTAAFGGTAASPFMTLTQTSAPGQLELTSAGIAGQITVGVSVTGVPGLTLGGTFGLAVNTTSAAANGLPAGPYLRIAATGATVAFLGQSVTADVTVQRTTDATGASVLRLAIANGSVSFAGGAIALSGIAGVAMITGAGVAGSLTANISVAAADAISLGGAFSLAVNTTSSPVSDSVLVGTGSQALVLPAGPYFALRADNATLTVEGQTLSGTIAISQTTLPVLADPAGQPAPSPAGATAVPALQITISGGALRLGDGSVNFVSVSNVAGTVLVFDAAAAQQSVGGTSTVSLSGVAGQLSGQVQVQGVPGFAFSGAIAVSFNSTAHAIDALVGSSQLTWAAGPSFALSATGATLGIAGQTVSGDVTLTASSGSVQIAFANLAASFGGGLLTVQGGTGSLVLVNGAGAYGAVSGTVALGVSGASFTGGVTLEFNTTATDQSVALSGASVSLPHNTVQVTATNAQLVIAGQSIGGTFTIAATSAGSTQVSIAVSGLTLSLGSFLQITAANQVSGAVVISSAGVAGQFAPAGSGATPIAFSGLPSGMTITLGTVSLAFNTGATAVNQTIGMQTI
ncbi:MAG: large repetitive protein, partial [Mucilaginibacter sp.]|nr:large repetitive protein [Mucilaginibacter sp.]